MATNIVVVSTTSITAKTPAGTVGANSVSVTTAGGTATKINAFTYTSSFTGDGTDSSGSGKSGDGRATTSKGNGTDASEAQATTNPVVEDVVVAPMGAELYLQTIAIHPDTEVNCIERSTYPTDDSNGYFGPAVNDPFSANSRAALGTQRKLNEVDVVGPDDALVQPIDLDFNGEPDICQLRRGDLDLNDIIDERDLTILLNMIDTVPVLGIGDIDANGVFDAGDISLLLMQMTR